jgi:hypothetical protein
MIIQDFLKAHSLKDLEAEGIDYSIFDNGKLLQLNYNQISSKESSKMASECRNVLTQFLFDMYVGKAKSTLDSIKNKKDKDGFSHSLPSKKEAPML